MGRGAGRLVAKYGLAGLVVLCLGLLGLSSPRAPRPHELGPATRRALSLRGGAGSARPGQDVTEEEMERLAEEMGRLSPAQREKLLDELSGELPSVTPGAHYPGIDDERGGILPARVQTIRKDILDVDVDDTRLDDSVLCDRDSIFNTSATPARPEIAPEQSHYCVPDPKAFTNLPPVQMDVEDLAQFDYDFSESSEASGHAARRQQRASVVGARARRNLTEAEQADVDAATAKVRAGLEELPQEERDEMERWLEQLGWTYNDEVRVRRPDFNMAACSEGGGGGQTTLAPSDNSSARLPTDDLGRDVGMSPAHASVCVGQKKGGSGGGEGALCRDQVWKTDAHICRSMIRVCRKNAHIDRGQTYVHRDIGRRKYAACLHLLCRKHPKIQTYVHAERQVDRGTPI